jgi:FADH2 O2-dependent halogenase
MTQPRPDYDMLVLGSGFSGSLLAWILASCGRRVLLVDRQRHPRFAIGESSTPTADFLLAYAAERWGLKALAPLATWGSWKQEYPDVICGKKRGFSYYRHHAGHPFQDHVTHENSLLVAASSEDRWSDTHWLRSSVDHFFVQQAVAAGVELREEHELAAARFDRHEARWEVTLTMAGPAGQGDTTTRLRTAWMIDATGAANALAKWVHLGVDDQWMHTRTRATFGHFIGVEPFTVGQAADDPFCGDDAAQHHILDEGWCWMLRMDNGVTSVGLVEPCRRSSAPPAATPAATLVERLENYPSLAQLLARATCVAPSGGLVQTGRLSHCRSQAVGPGWVLLPVSYGFVDPLHSTGIAHALSGVVRVADALLARSDVGTERLRRYADDLRQEISWLDVLVAGCYAGQPSFQRFYAFACFYFVAAMAFEQQLAADPSHWPLGFLQSQDRTLRDAANEAWALQGQLKNVFHPSADFTMTEKVRACLAPWNRVQLLDPKVANRIAHSAAPKFATWKTQCASE